MIPHEQLAAIVIDDLALKSFRWTVVAGGFLAIVYRHRSILDRSGLLREVALVVFAYFTYFAVRGLTVGGEAQAVANAARVIDFERTLGLFHERWLQGLIIDHLTLVQLANFTYIWGHWPLIILVAAWLYLYRPVTYRLYRNAFLISGAIGLIVFALFPVAPPRLAGIDIIDTVTVHTGSYRTVQPPGLVNEYAAVPSLHFGWNLLIGIILVTNCRSLLTRVAGALVPPFMFLSIVLTANHYIIDAIAGGFVALLGLFIAYMLREPGQAAADLSLDDAYGRRYRSG